MDTTQTISLSSLVLIASGLTAYLVKLNHKRVRSTCCNKVCITSIDVEETSPVRPELKITIPADK